MNGNKTAILANFNCTFGEEYLPMLTHFSKIIYPALKSKTLSKENIRDNKVVSKTYFSDIKVVRNETFGLMLKGKIVLDRSYKVKSLSDENKNVEDTNIAHPMSPYSFFTILLRNHRMIYIKNQGESPSLSTFKATCDFFLKSYIKDINTRIKEQKNSQISLFEEFSSKKEIDPLYEDLILLPDFHLDIIEQLDQVKVKEFIQKAASIEKFSVRVEVQNAGAPFEGIMKRLEDEVKITGSKAIDSTWENPTKKEPLINIAEQSNGRGSISCTAKTPNGDVESLDKEENVKYSKGVYITDNSSDEQIIDQLSSQLGNSTPLKVEGLHNAKERDFYQKIKKFFFKN